MKAKLVRQTARVIEGDGVNRPELTMGYIEIERQFQVFDDGHMRLDTSAAERLLTVDDRPVNCLWNRSTLEEFFPGYSGLEALD